MRIAWFIETSLLLLALASCGSDSDEPTTSTPTTKATRVEYAGGLPASGSVPASGSTWYEVAGLSAATAYTASVSGQGKVGLEVYKLLEPTPPNSLCASGSPNATASCSFTASGTSAFVLIKNYGTGPDTVTLTVSAP